MLSLIFHLVGLVFFGGGVVISGLLFRAACRAYNHFWAPQALPAKADGAAKAVSYHPVAAGPYTSPSHYEAADPPASVDHPDAAPVPHLLRSVVISLAILIVAWIVVPITGGLFFAGGMHLIESGWLLGYAVFAVGIVIATVAAVSAAALLISWSIQIPFTRALRVIWVYLAFAVGTYVLLAAFFTALSWLLMWYVESRTV